MSGPLPTPDLPATFTQARPLGQGAFGQVLAAVDGAGRAVAVKLLASGPEQAWSFEDEFRRLARLDHPGFPKAYERGLTPGGLPYFTMALVEPGPALPPREVVQALADALAYLHGLGLVHGDVKAENVVGTVLLDVGLLGPAGRPRQEVAGSLAYLAPEALRRAPVGPEADVYALGVLAFELLEGHLPFAGTPAEILRGHLQAPAPRPAGELGPLVERMLAKDPAARPSAAAVRAWLAGEPAPPTPVALRPGPFVGREELLAAWQQALEASGLVPVVAEGVGKSRALEELRLAAQLAGRGWAGATCLPEAGLPAAPVRAAIARALGDRPTDPLLAAWLAGEPILPDLDPAARQAAAFGAAASALGDAARAAGGLALGFDDWHLADDASKAFLELLARAQADAPLALALAAGGEGLLRPLTPAEVETWLQARLGGDAPAGLASLLAAAAGNPQLLDLTLEHLVAGGALHHDGAWRLAPDAQGPQALAGAWEHRLAELPPEARALAGLAAQIPGAVPMPLLAAEAGLDPDAAALAAETLAAAGILQLADGRARVVASLWREPDPALASRLARQLAGSGSWAHQPASPPEAWQADPLLAARLALLGDDDALAVELAGRAGRLTLAQAAPAMAVTWLQAAVARSAGSAPAEVLLPLAEALRFGDRLPEALEAYDQLDPSAPALIGRAKCLQMQGQYAEAQAGYEAAEAIAPEPALAARAAASLARVLAFTGKPAEARAAADRAAERARAAGATAVLVQALTMQGLLLAQAEPGRAPAAVAMLEEALGLARGLGDRAGQALVLDNMGNVRLAAGDLRGAQRAFATYAAHCRACGFATEALAAALNQALVAAERGEHEAALAFAEIAERDAGRAGRRFILAAALAAKAQAQLRGGGSPWAALDRALELAAAIGNKVLEELVRLVRLEALLAEGGDAAGELALLEPLVATTGHAEAAAKLDCARAELMLRGPASPASTNPAAGPAAGAASNLDQAASFAARAATSPNQVARHRGLQLLAEIALAAGDPEAALDPALAALALATAWDAPWHLAADRALVSRARLLGGDERGAISDARLVLANPHAPAPARAAMAALTSAPAVTGGLDLARYGRWIEALATAPDEAAIAAAALDGVMDLVQAERGYLIGYAEGRIAQVATRGIDYATEAAAGFSQTMVQRVLYAGVPLAVADARTDPAWRDVASVAALDLRAVVCLPLATPDAILGVIYADRRDLEPAVSDGDLALLAAYATAAASALRREAQRADLEASYELATHLAAPLLQAHHAMLARAIVEAAQALVGADRGFWLAPPYQADGPSQGIVAHVAATGEPLGIIDLQDDEAWQDRRSVQALGLRSVWCLPTGAPDGSLLYLDTTRPATGDPADRLQGLEALVRAARPLFSS